MAICAEIQGPHSLVAVKVRGALLVEFWKLTALVVEKDEGFSLASSPLDRRLGEQGTSSIHNK